jgi:hypothetical protein
MPQPTQTTPADAAAAYLRNPLRLSMASSKQYGQPKRLRRHNEFHRDVILNEVKNLNRFIDSKSEILRLRLRMTSRHRLAPTTATIGVRSIA